MELFFCGDCCPGGVLAYQDTYIDDDLKKMLKGFDFRIATLEAAVGTDLPYESSKMPQNGGAANICYIRNEDFFRLKELNINLVTLANNHSVDLGVVGLKNTLRLLNENNIKYCGAGLNIEEAAKPAVVVDEEGKKIAFFAFCIEGTFPYVCNQAGKATPGIYKADINTILEKIHSYSREFDQLILLPHWGMEHRFFPPVECQQYAKKMIEAGASAIFGSHSHTFGPYTRCNGKLISFAMGNFLFPDFMMTPPRPMFYPPKENLQCYRRVINYPKKIDEPTISVWDKNSRIAMNWVYDTGKNTSAKYFLTVLSSDNILHSLKKVSYVRNFFLRAVKIPFGNIVVRFSFYWLFHKAVKKVR